MTENVQLVAFDLDDTLAPSKSTVPSVIAALLLSLLEHVEVCVISGGQFAQFEAQLIASLSASSQHQLAKLHLMPTCGTQYYRFSGVWNRVYAEVLSEDQKVRALGALEVSAKDLGLWSTDTWGPILEDRDSQITFSALGQSAPVSAKSAWDPDGSKKEALRERVARQLPDLEARSGGSTSVDVTRAGIDKAYGMRRLAEITQIPFERMLFVGDRLDVGGNDFPVVALGITTQSVRDWKDTAELIEGLIPRFANLNGERRQAS
jgi:HAD superfamily hydrolase (TIGR01484 family)